MDIRARLQDHLGDAFQIERELGGGGMSRVFVATEVRLNRRVAIKVLMPELAQGLNAERFEREILMAASLQQANIVPLLAASDFDGLPYFTMPFIEGESLRARLMGPILSISEVIAVLRDVTRALEYAHARGIVHRDIKPDNVLLSGATAVVTDFGIAKALSASRAAETGGTLTSVGMSMGTPAYMAPEQVAGDPDIDHRVDLYALGCLAYELLTGRSPFGDRPPPKMLAAHLSEVPASVNDVREDCPPALTSLVAQLLQKDPADRPATATEVLRALEDVTNSGSGSTEALAGPIGLARVLGLYVVATVAVAIVAKAAVVGIGLPDWTFTGAIGLMLLGLPVLLLTAYVKSVAQRNAHTIRTPGGTTVGRAPTGTLSTLALTAHRHLSWRRNLRYGIVAMGGFVLLVTGYMVTRQLGIGPAASLFASGTLAAQDRVLLAAFTAAPEDSALAPIVQSAVREAMSQSRAIQLLSPAEVAGVLVRMERAPDAAVDPATAREVATRGNAKAILGGRLARVGSGTAYAISLELISATDGAPLASFQGTAADVEDLLGVVDDLTRKLRGKLGESLKRVQGAVPLARATTGNLDALRKYTDAVRANDVERDFDRAVVLLREAVALDTTFALAYRKLSAALTNSGAPQVARDSALERAARHADRLPPLERHMVLGAFHQGHSTLGDRRKALAAYTAALNEDSTETAALNQLALLYGSREQPDSALVYTRRQFRLAPTLANASKVLRGLILVNRLQDAERFADSLKGALPEVTEDASFLSLLALAAYVQGDVDSATRIIDVVADGPLPTDRIIAASMTADVAFTSGKLKTYLTAMAVLQDYLGARGNASLVEGFPEAMSDIFSGQRVAQGVARLDQIVASPAWAALPPVDRPWIMTVALYAMANAPDRGRALMAQWRTVAPELATSRELQPIVNWADAELLLAEGKPTEALAGFRRAAVSPDGAPSGLGPTVLYGIARSFDQARQPDSARVYFERYLAIPTAQRFGSINDPIALAATRKHLGELYDAKGDRSRAIQYYQAFVDQWAEADPELQPTVASVRKRIEELKQQGG